MVNLLTIMAHADDAELWAGGVIALTTARGDTATIALPASDSVRDLEAASGVKVLGATLQLMPTLATLDAEAIREVLIQLRPEVVITHSGSDIHPEHQHVARLVATALPEVVIATGHPQRVYACDGYWNLANDGRPLHLPTIIDITEAWETKTRALATHESQPILDHFGPMAETLGRLHGGRIGTRYAEAFGPVPILGKVSGSARL